jgi:hypothetical protein
VASPQDWLGLPGTQLTWPESEFWWNIDIRSSDRIGDVKWTWELGRHRDLVVLARASRIDVEGPWLHALHERLRWWFDATPSEVGIHWYSNLEISLRIIAWIQIHALLHDQVDPVLQRRMAEHVGAAERHLIFDFPYTASSMRNNHLLGDALGLIAIDRFTGGNGSSRLARAAERFFRGQLARHMLPDGSMIEDSLSYHRFVMEMLAVKTLLGDDSVGTREWLAASAQHLVRLGALTEDPPQWGDWDEGRVLASSGDAVEIAGSTALALVLSHERTQSDWSDRFDEVAWYGGADEEREPAAGLESSIPAPVSSSGGLVHIREGSWSVWVKTGTQPSHQHADLTHVSIKFQDQWIIVDPGTGTYNGELVIRNAFRGAGAHNGIRVRGTETMRPHRAFRWLGGPSAVESRVLEVGGAHVVVSVHDAFVDAHQCRVARLVVVTVDAVTCCDWLERPLPGVVTLAMAPDVQLSARSLISADGTELQLDSPGQARVARGQNEPFEGWHSSTYGTWEPASWLTYETPHRAVSYWSVSDGPSPSVRVRAESVEVADVSFHIGFHDDGTRVTAAHAGTRQVLHLGKGRA